MKKNKIRIVLFLITTVISLNGFSQKPKQFGNVVVDFNEVPNRGGFRKTVTGIEKAKANHKNDSLHYKVKVSKNEGIVGVIEENNSYYFRTKSDKKHPSNTVKVYDNKGKKLFEKDFGGHRVSNLTFSNNDQYIIVNTHYEIEDSYSNFSMTCYDRNGKEIYTKKNASYPKTSLKNKNVIYFTQGVNSEDNEIALVVYDLEAKDYKLKKNYNEKELRLLDVSGNGNSIVLMKENKIECLTIDNTNNYSLNYSDGPGIFRISDNGQYLLNCKVANQAIVYNTENDSVIVDIRKKLKTPIGETYFIRGGFVKNGGDIIYLSTFFNANETYIWFLNLKAEIIDHIIVSDHAILQTDELEVMVIANKAVVLCNGKVMAESYVKWRK